MGNESKIIERNLSAALPVLDAICACVNGSDNTQEVVQNFGAARKIPTKVERHVWKHFAHNRTLSFQTMVAFIKELGWEPQDVYGLLLDADMILEVGPAFQKQDLTHASYSLTQENSYSHLAYDNVRLIRCDLPWICGITWTHECWYAKGQGWKALLRTLTINDLGDGGSKENKFLRDVKLLTEELKEEPNNDRCVFYLANSHKNLGHLEEAIAYYRQRIGMSGPPDELWYSRYMIGECCAVMAERASSKASELLKEVRGLEGKAEAAKKEEAAAKERESREKQDLAASAYLDAYEFLPRRAESLYGLSHMYRVVGRNALGFLYAEAGEKIPYPAGGGLFVEKPVYTYKFAEEKSITGYYVAEKRQQGFAAADFLIHSTKVPERVKDLAQKNISYYVGKLPTARCRALKLDFFSKIEIDGPVGPGEPQYRRGAESTIKAAPVALVDGTTVCLVVFLERDAVLAWFAEGDESPVIKPVAGLFSFERDGAAGGRAHIRDLENPRLFCCEGAEHKSRALWVVGSLGRDLFLLELGESSSGRSEYSVLRALRIAKWAQARLVSACPTKREAERRTPETKAPRARRGKWSCLLSRWKRR